ncbi:membrane protein [Streptomyces leeuwenhoekii]|uniref:Membrane protein n=1 Tax=Streptomyces leeuwenhoekii TaxID=1437453 RepID=A0ABR5HV11_STRLW|nr:membrane protein [Streptomyces leeuwenhoekii]KMS75844.1 membrane protein [Streptomyces leeuwenhoekii]
MTGMGVAERGAPDARHRALAVLRVRSRAVAVAVLPAAAAVILFAGGSTGLLPGRGWDVARWTVTAVAVVVLLSAAGVALFVARARPAVSPTVPIAEESAPDLYRMVRDLADRLDVPAPSAIALTPDCDSWLEDRTHPAHGPPPAREHDGSAGPGGGARRRPAAAPVLVIGSPFLWWMRVGELRAVLAPVVAGTGPSAHPDIAAARRFVRGLDAAVAVASAPTRGRLSRAVCAAVGWVSRLLLRSCRVHAAEMERGVAVAAAQRAQSVDYGLRIVAQEQVGLAYAGWDRLLTKVALPAWRMGRWPSRLDAGVVAALTELSRRDRLAEGFASRLGERPACDLLEEPGAVDEAASLLAARLFHGGPAEPGPDWSSVEWHEYPEEVVDRAWRTDAARLHRVLDALGVRRTAAGTGPEADGPTLARVLDHLTDPAAAGVRPRADHAAPADRAAWPDPPDVADPPDPPAPYGRPHPDDETAPPRPPAPTPGAAPAHAPDPEQDREAAPAPHDAPAPEAPAPVDAPAPEDEELSGTTPRSAALAARLSAQLAREEAKAQRPAPPGPPPAAPPGPDTALWDDHPLPLFPLQPPRAARDLLTDHITALVCCAAMDTAGATPGLDWLDGPVLLIGGERASDLAPRVHTLVESGDPAPLRAWLVDLGIRPEKPVRLV